jgi:hypothetical protein
MKREREREISKRRKYSKKKKILINILRKKIRILFIWQKLT